MIINTEWGAFGDNGAIDFIRTEADRNVDKNSLNPGKQLWVAKNSGNFVVDLGLDLDLEYSFIL